MTLVLTDALRWWERAAPERTALVCDGEEVNYGLLGAWTDRVAASLAAEWDVSPGDVVAIAGTNSLEWCVAAIGAIKAGAIATPVNYRYTASEVTRLLNDCSPRVVIADDHERTKVDEAIVKSGSSTAMPMSRVRELEHGPKTGIRVERESSDPAVLAYTSGTTGDPKGLVYTNQSLLMSLFELLIKDATPAEETSMLVPLPLFSVGGIVHSVIHMLCRGAKSVVMRDFDPAEALSLIQMHRISHMNGVPVIYEMMSAQPGFGDLDLSHLKVAMVGGARVSDRLLSAFNARGVALRHMYGMTEVGGCGTVPRPADALAYPELCGDGSIFTEIRTIREDGSLADRGEPGEIMMRGPGMMARYWNRPEATSAALMDGWIRSGDLGVIDERGYLRFVDRLKDLIISGGFNVSPSEVEGVLSGVPGVDEIAVIAVPDDRWGETPTAIIYSADGSVDLDEVKATAERELAVFKVPRYVVRSDGPLPRMGSGKLDKRAIRERYGNVVTHADTGA